MGNPRVGNLMSLSLKICGSGPVIECGIGAGGTFGSTSLDQWSSRGVRGTIEALKQAAPVRLISVTILCVEQFERFQFQLWRFRRQGIRFGAGRRGATREVLCVGDQ